jgi:flagellar hook protein FlgE
MSFAGVFSIAISGVNAFARGLAAVSTNIANSQTVGFKRVQTDFADLVSADAPDAGRRLSGGVGATPRTLATEQGALKRTDIATNVAIAGAGYFVVAEDAAASPPFLFTRSGDFRANAAGDLVNGAGYYLQGYPTDASGAAAVGGLAGLQTVNINRTPPIAAGASPPGELIGVDVDARGRVVGRYATGETIPLFQIALALFPNAEGLEAARGTAFRQTTPSGAIALAAAGSGRAGAIEGAALEISTVDIGREFSILIETQRAYATNARVINVADELLETLVSTAA